MPDDDTLYPYINNDIKYGLFEGIVYSYYLDSQIKDDFQCDHDCYTCQQESMVDDHSISCTHAYNHIVQYIQDLPDSTQQHTLHSMEENASLFTDDAATPCDFNITNQNSVTENTNDTSIPHTLKQSSIHTQSKHTYRNTFVESNIQYHNFDNQDSLTFRDKYTTLLQQELQNPYWSLYDPVTTKSYQISKDMDIETEPYQEGFSPHPLGIADKFDTYEKAHKNTLLNKFPIETLNNKLQEVTLPDGSKELDYLPGTTMDYASTWYYYGLCINAWLKEASRLNIKKQGKLIIDKKMKLQISHRLAHQLNAMNIEQAMTDR